MTYYQRNLPHWQPEGKSLFITWRLWGTLPAARWAKIRAAVEDQKNARTGVSAQQGLTSARTRVSAPLEPDELFLAVDRELDRADQGTAWLKKPEIAAAVTDAIRRGEEIGQYRLDAFVVMPNHVHILIEPVVDPIRLLKSLKGASARDANRILGRVGKPFWQDESFDHWVRNGAELERTRAYIHQNPVKAKLVERAEDWIWSSATRIRPG